MRSLIARQGGDATVVASMREVPLAENPAAIHFGEELLAGRVHAVLFLTGVGAGTLLDVLKSRFEAADLVAALAATHVIVRGPKPVAVLKKWGIGIDLRAPEPNTWRETADAIRAAFDLSGKTVAVQEYGKPNPALYDQLRSQGANVLPVPVYRWALPEETAPLEAALRDAAAGSFEIVAFTSAQQIDNVLEVADRIGVADSFRKAVRNAVLVSIGPTCSERLRECGLEPDLEASPPKMGQMVRLALEHAPEILARKGSRQDSQSTSAGPGERGADR